MPLARHATALLRAGKSIKAVSRRLGHSTVELTLRVYVHVLPADDHDLADAAESGELERVRGIAAFLLAGYGEPLDAT